MTPAQLEELKKLCAEATPGPWEVFRIVSPRAESQRLFAVAGGASIDIAHAPAQWVEHCGCDLDFAAAARSAVPELIAEVERLRGLVKEAECSGYELMAGAGRAASIKCPWCHSYRPATGDFHHGVDCPAFGPEGEVK